MLASERRNYIIQKLNEFGSVRVNEIARGLQVSTETVRKDLAALEKEGLLRKEFGGAVATFSQGGERPVELRSMSMRTEKEWIARTALSLLPADGVVFVDSGSTLLSFAKIIPYCPRLTFITNSIPAMAPLVSSRNVAYLLGGEFNEITQSTTGFWASQNISSLDIDVAFLGNSGCAFRTGPCVKQSNDAQLKQDIIRHSKKVVVMFDHSKMSTNAICQYTTWDQIHVIITDVPLEPSLLEQIPDTTEILISEPAPPF